MAELVARWKRFSREHPGVTDIKEIVKVLKLPKENVKLLKRIMATANISGANLDAEEVSDLTAFFEDQSDVANPEVNVGNHEDMRFLQERLSQLARREAEVLRYRYGLDDYPVMTLEEIGKVFSLTRERVRQIETKAIKRLRELIPEENVL
jgi:RNA polymerase primary sigma factor